MKNKLLAIFASLLLAGCASTTDGGLVGESGSQLLLVSADTMEKSALTAYSSTLSEAKSKHILNPNSAQTQRVRNIANRLIAQVGVFRKDALKWDWQVNVIKEDTINAWCMPGGKIAVYTGIIEKLNLTDGELAAVMGHEIAHALREHSRERASQDQLRKVGIFAVSSATGLGSTSQSLLEMASQYTIALPFSRSHETQADRIGTELMARAGYNPYDAVSVWQKMSKLSKSSTPQIMSTHPSHESRIADLTEVAKKVMPLYEAAKAGR